jgi:hypothetical protein
MTYVHSLGRACAITRKERCRLSDGAAVSFKQLHERVQNIVAALSANGEGLWLVLRGPRRPSLLGGRK